MSIKILVNGQDFDFDFPSDQEITLENFKQFLRRQLPDDDTTQVIFSLPESPDLMLNDDALYDNLVEELRHSEVEDVDVFNPASADDYTTDLNDLNVVQLHVGPAPNEADEHLNSIATNSHGTMGRMLKGTVAPQTVVSDEKHPAEPNDATAKTEQSPTTDSAQPIAQANAIAETIRPVENPALKSPVRTDATPAIELPWYVLVLQTIKNFFLPPTEIATPAPQAPVTTPTSMSPHKMARTLVQKDIAYQPLPIATTQPAVHGHPVAQVKTSPTPINFSEPEDQQLASFHSEMQSNELKEFHQALSNAFQLCSLNQFGGLKQHIPSGVRFMQDWLNSWVNSTDPNAVAWSTLKVIGNEASDRQGNIDSFKGIRNYFKKQIFRDEYVKSIYTTLEELSECADKRDPVKLSAITTKLTQLYTTQQQKINEAEAARQKEEAAVSQFNLL